MGLSIADGPLTFDLQADDEEEDRHQPVVDNAVEVLGESNEPTETSTGVDHNAS